MLFINKKIDRASAGSWTRIDCLEGNHANRYTTDAIGIIILYVCQFAVQYGIYQLYNDIFNVPISIFSYWKLLMFKFSVFLYPFSICSKCKQIKQ